MRKLLDREPTEEMLEAGMLGGYGDLRTYIKHAYYAMFDAAPEVKVSLTAVDMEPVARVLTEEEMGIGMDRRYGPVIWIGKPPVGNIYSAEQLVNALSEQDYEYNRKTNALIERHSEQLATLQADNERLTAERDELLAAIQDIYRNYPDQPFVYTTARDVFIKYAKKAKHEGEKNV